MAIIVGVRRLAKRGIIVKNGEGLERLKEVKTFIFDKTGTITKGKIKVSKYEGEIELACALEKLSNHPIAKAIASLKGVNAEIKEFTEFQGKGVYGVVNGKVVIVGNKDFVMSNCTGNSKDADVLVCIDGEVRGYIWLEDEIREEAFEVVKWLKERGYNVIIATGDSSSFAEKVGEALGVKVYNGLSPEEKVELVKKFEKVAFVGDGANDAMALKESYVGIAVSSGADIAKYAGDIVIPSLSSIPQLLERGSKIVRKVKENVIWALAYNTVLIPISAGILYPFYLPPQYAALAMSMNSVSVVLWSLVDSL
jgi:Cu2+-exporting ATPase